MKVEQESDAATTQPDPVTQRPERSELPAAPPAENPEWWRNDAPGPREVQ